MDGVGSRLGRASSRYVPAATVFNGPVRKWKKKWVHVSPSSTTSSKSNTRKINTNNINASSRLLLCKWTPLSSSTDEDNVTDGADEPPRRRIRYTPIAVLEEKKKVVSEHVEHKAKEDETNPFAPWSSSQHNELNINKDLKKENQESNTSHLDLGLCLKGHNDDHDNKETQSKTATSSGFWTMG